MFLTDDDLHSNIIHVVVMVISWVGLSPQTLGVNNYSILRIKQQPTTVNFDPLLTTDAAASGTQ